MEMKTNLREKMMDLLAKDMEKMHEIFADACEAEQDPRKRMEVCHEYAQTISGLGLMLSTVSMMRTTDDFPMMGLGLGGLMGQ